MKKVLVFLVVVFLLTLNVVWAGADVAPATAPTFMSWFAANENGLLKFALALSEFLALIPFFKGNGVLDTIVKALKALSEREK